MAINRLEANVDEICAHFMRFADTIERMAASKSISLGENIVKMTDTVVDAKNQLSELAGSARLDAQRSTTVLNLVHRYRQIEGTLKELRNDIHGKRREPSHRSPVDEAARPEQGRDIPSGGLAKKRI